MDGIYKVHIFSQSENKTNYNKDTVYSICAHEFGHVFGLMDAYANENKESLNVRPVSFLNEYIDEKETIPSEIYFTDDTSKYNTDEAGEIMFHNGKVCSNDIEMVVFARKQNKPQIFVPIGYIDEVDGGKTIKHKYGLSGAIKAKYIYYAYNEYAEYDGDGNEIWHIYAGKYYYYDKKYKTITATTSVYDFTGLTDDSTEEYQIYLKYLDKIKPHPAGVH